jgi:hypothetical protein
MPAWTVTLTYVGYALTLLLAAAAWAAALTDTLIHRSVDLGSLDERWRDTAWLLYRHAETALLLAAACGGLAFLFALPALFASAEASPAVQSHRDYQLKAAAILLLLLCLVSLARGRMGAFDADLAAVALFGWALWAVAAGWLAQAGGTPATGPAGWWLALGVAGLGVAGLVALMIALKLSGGIRMM